jgi:hypothetical protein
MILLYHIGGSMSRLFEDFKGAFLCPFCFCDNYCFSSQLLAGGFFIFCTAVLLQFLRLDAPDICVGSKKRSPTAGTVRLSE